MPRSVLALGLLLGVLAAAQAHAYSETVLLRSSASAAYLRASGGDYEQLLGPWRTFFKATGIKARELAAEELSRVKGRAVLILPASVALSEAERKAVRSRVASGWSVLGTWAVGARDERGKWLGYGFIEELFGAKIVSDEQPHKDFRFLLPYGETPLTHAVAAGTRMYLRPVSEPPLRFQARNVAARMTSYVRDASSSAALLGAASFEERDGARRAYFGFAESSWDSAQSEMHAVLSGTLEWLRRKPVVVKSAWPDPHDAALLIEMDTEDKFGNAVVLAEQLERYKLRGTFYCLTSEAAKHPRVLKRLAERHEIAYHAEVHEGFAKLERAKQEARIKAMVKQMAGLLPDVSQATGFRPPLEEYDATTEKVLAEHGFRHVAASLDSRADALPGFSAADARLVVLPRTWPDDIALLRGGQLKEDSAAAALQASLQDTIATRGFGLLSLHSQHFQKGGVMAKVLPRLLEQAARPQSRVWLASASSIERWWRAREAVRVTTRIDASGVSVALAAQGPVPRLKLVLMTPKAPELDAEARGIRLAKLDDYRWALVFDELPRGETRVRVRL